MKEIEIKINEEKTTILASDIKKAYIPASKFGKVAASYKHISKLKNIGNEDPEAEKYLNDGYSFFEKQTVKIKSKEMTLMLQLLNPTFCAVYRVYHDPFASSGMTMGSGALAVNVSDPRSYYFKESKKDTPAYKFVKGKFKAEFIKYFGDCPEIKEEVNSDPKWSKFAEYVAKASKCQ